MEITIPTEWEDITIETYIKLRPALNTKTNEIERLINILCVLSDRKRQEVEKLTITQYSDLISKMRFLNKDLPTKVKSNVFKVGESWYEFCLKPDGILFGEYISIMEILEKANNNEEMLFNNLHNFLTVICRPIKKRWWGYKYIDVDTELINKTADNFYRNMPITIAYPIAVFFSLNLETLTQVIKTSLESLIEKKAKMAQVQMAR